jgi:hypothetical protein
MAVKYQLETIPVWKALEADTECLLCELEIESERRNTDFFLGSSIMAPEMRVEVNEHGFCPRHFHMLLAGTGKLGYSLALNTHRAHARERLRELRRRLTGAGGRAAAKTAESVAAELTRLERECLMCDRIRYNLRNYSYTVVKLFSTDPEFRAAFTNSRGVCLHHMPLLLTMGADLLRGDELHAFNQALAETTDRALVRLGEELEQFTWQFDYQDERRTPDSAQDSVARAVRKLAGFGPGRLP